MVVQLIKKVIDMIKSLINFIIKKLNSLFNISRKTKIIVLTALVLLLAVYIYQGDSSSAVAPNIDTSTVSEPRGLSDMLTPSESFFPQSNVPGRAEVISLDIPDMTTTTAFPRYENVPAAPILPEVEQTLGPDYGAVTPINDSRVAKMSFRL